MLVVFLLLHLIKMYVKTKLPTPKKAQFFEDEDEDQFKREN